MNMQEQRTTVADTNGVRRLPDTARIQYAHFRVLDIERSLGFYKDLLGLVESGSNGNTLMLAAEGSDEPLVKLTEDRNAVPRQHQAPGLFHLALLYPDRKSLAAAFKHLYVNQWPFQGFADHGVSEALYLADAEGNGIELYVDRPKVEWPYKHGELQMVTETLDLDDLLSKLDPLNGINRSNSRDLSIGHIHLQISNLQRTEAFYHGALGFDVVQRNYPGALFMSAGGYHHHIGANVWNSRGAAPAADGSAGLMEFGIRTGNAQVTQELSAQFRETEFWLEGVNEDFTLRDPDALRIHIS